LGLDSAGGSGIIILYARDFGKTKLLLCEGPKYYKGGEMKHKSIAVALITVILCMVLGNGIACTTPTTDHNLTISSTEGGEVTTPGEGTYTYCEEQGNKVNLVASPDAGYRFVKWTGNVGTISNVKAATTTITMNDDYSITANFEAIPSVKQYDLTTSSTEGGSVTTPGEGTHTYDEGEVVRVVAEANEGYRFDEWIGDTGTIADVNAAITTITVNDDHSITANFVKQYDLTTSSTEGGSVTTPGVGTHTYDEGEVVNLVAVADGGCGFVNWTGDVGTIADVNATATNITMNDDYSIAANFVQQCGCG
jgi:ribosomal protein L21E